MEENGKHVNLDDINRHLGEIMHAQNAAPKPDFNGFSSEQMHQMLNRPLEVGCPVQLRRLTDEQMERIPVMRQALHLLTSSFVRYFYLPHDGTYGFKGVSEDLTGDAG